jgi:hypothetical protein
MSRSKKSGNPKTEMRLVRNPEVDDVAALFEQLTGRKPTAAEMLEVEQTLGPVPTLEFPRPSHCDVEQHTKGAGTESPAANGGGMKPKRQPPGTPMWKLPPGFEDVTAEAIAAGTIFALVPAPQVTPRKDAGHTPDRVSEKPRVQRRHRPR